MNVQPLKSIIGKAVKNNLIVFLVLFVIVAGYAKGTEYMAHKDIPREFREFLIKPVSAHEVEEDFLCPCCGQEVAECDCGMAEERRAFIEKRLSEGKNTMEIYSEYAAEFDISEFKEDELAATVEDYLAYSAPEDRPSIEIPEDTKEMGELVQKDYKEGDRLEMEFEIRNAGNRDLVISGLNTSCMCTSARIIAGDQKSPEVSMSHEGDEETEEWNVTIKPGDQATLEVYYDPNAHGEFSGDITRTVTLETNDPVKPNVSVKFELTQI